MSITTLKLFETLLTKPNEQIINNLVLRNLLGRSYVTMETIDSGHHSPTPNEQGHHHDNHNNTDSLHSNNNNAGQGQSQVRVSDGEAVETSTNTEHETPSQTSSSSDVKNVDNSQNVVSTDQNQRDPGEQQEQEQKTSSELLTNGANVTTASSEDKSRSSPSDKISNDKGDSANKTDEPGKDNAKESEQSVSGDAETHRQRHHSDFESELDEILGRVSSYGEGDNNRDTRADSSSRVKSSSQIGAGAVEEEAQIVSRYGNVQFIQ